MEKFLALSKQFLNLALRGDNKKTKTQATRYLLVGLAAYIVDFGLLIFFTEVFNIFYLISATASFLIGILVNYWLSIRWVFPSRNLKNRYLEFGGFAVVGIVGLFLNDFLILLITQKAGLNYIVSKLLASVMVLIWNFVARKYTLFR